MWEYQKTLQFPRNIKNPNPKLASFIVSQYGGPDGELAASLRYLSQRYGMKDNVVKGLLTDIGTEELGHLEMVGTIVHQLSRCATTGENEKSPMAPYFIDNGRAVFPTSAPGFPFSAASIASKSDIIANLVEDLAADGTISYAQHYVL